MLANRLNMLLAERQLTIKQVVEATKISRSTISNIVNNPGANVATETIDILCQYLGTEPKNFFIYAPYSIKIIEFEHPSNGFYVNVIQSKKENTFIFTIQLENSDIDRETEFSPKKYDLYLTIAGDFEEDFQIIYDKLPIAFKTQVTTSFLATIEYHLKNNQAGKVYIVDDKNKDYSSRKVSLTDYAMSLSKNNLLVNIRLPWEDTSKIFDVKKGQFK